MMVFVHMVRMQRTVSYTHLRLRGGLCHKIFYVAHTTFAKQCLVLLGNKAALALHRLDKALAFKIGIGALGGNHAYAQPIG